VQAAIISGWKFHTVNNMLHRYTDCVLLEGPHFLASTVATVSFITLSKGYYHSESFSCLLHWLLNLPRLSIWHNEILGRHSLFKQEKNTIFVKRIVWAVKKAKFITGTVSYSATTVLPVQWVVSLSWGYSSPDMVLNTHPHLALRLNKRAVITLPPLWALTAWSRVLSKCSQTVTK
jgi:hypothetical protein